MSKGYIAFIIFKPVCALYRKLFSSFVFKNKFTNDQRHVISYPGSPL